MSPIFSDAENSSLIHVKNKAFVQNVSLLHRTWNRNYLRSHSTRTELDEWPKNVTVMDMEIYPLCEMWNDLSINILVVPIQLMIYIIIRVVFDYKMVWDDVYVCSNPYYTLLHCQGRFKPLLHNTRSLENVLNFPSIVSNYVSWCSVYDIRKPLPSFHKSINGV